MSLVTNVRAMMATDNFKQLAVVFAIGIGAFYVLSKVLREVSHRLFPSFFPGEPNTALLASPRINTSKAASADELEGVKEYDYIIVGTGTAGCVIANRLTEDPNVSVLAIESGHSDLKQIFSRIPAAFAQLFHGPADWDIFTEKDPGCNNRKLAWPRGKMLGGCSAMNAMIYNRGAPADYDEWEAIGCKGWSFKSLVPYMNRAESFTPDPMHGISHADLNEHGRTGPWKVGYAYLTSLTETFVDACAAIGIPKINDFNTSKGMIGAAPFQSFIDPHGQRSSTAVAYLTEDVASRPNLHIATAQTVTKIIFSKSSASEVPRAVGVEMATSKISPVRYLARARREVILSAGAIHTPHLLKLSGIGASQELTSHSIPVVVDSPGVGENMADHICSFQTMISKKPSLHYMLSPTQSLPALVQWLRDGTGPMRSNVAEAGAFIRTADMPDAPASLKNNDLTSGKAAADIEFIFGPLAFINHGQTIAPFKNDYCGIGSVMLRPESRGTVELASNNVFDAPLVKANYFSTKHDRDLMVYATRKANELGRSKPFMDATFDGWYLPSKKGVEELTDEEVLTFIRDTSETLYHPMGTAKMGRKDDGAVVDDRLRVHGVQGLRIADASIFPTPVACHPCAVVVMVGEKASDLIKEDWSGAADITDT